MTEDPLIAEELGGDEPNVVEEDLFLNQTCCDDCQVGADQVDVYYWSNPNANTSCLSIVGNGNSDLAVGATTDPSGVYWACTSWLFSQGLPGHGSPLIVKTAELTTLASMTFRTYLYDPWGESPCENSTASLSSNLNPKIEPRSIPLSLRRRGHSLIAPNDSVSTAVLSGFTL